MADSGPISWYRAARSRRECACALCWSPWRGLGAKTRLSRLVLNFLPSAPALYGLPSLPCRALGGGRIGEVGGLAELSALTDRTLLPNPPLSPPCLLPSPPDPPGPRATAGPRPSPQPGPAGAFRALPGVFFRTLLGEAYYPPPGTGLAGPGEAGWRRWRLGILRRVAEYEDAPPPRRRTRTP